MTVSLIGLKRLPLLPLARHGAVGHKCHEEGVSVLMHTLYVGGVQDVRWGGK